MSISFQEIKHEDNGRAGIWAVGGLDAAGGQVPSRGLSCVSHFWRWEDT